MSESTADDEPREQLDDEDDDDLLAELREVARKADPEPMDLTFGLKMIRPEQ